MSSNRLGIIMNRGAYLPEAFAYQSFLSRRGWTVELIFGKRVGSGFEGLIRFMGTAFRGSNSFEGPEIHEYNSLSTGRLPRVKNIVKRLANRAPAGRIFLSDFVMKEFGFNDGLPHLLRDMGVSKGFFEKKGPPRKEFDLVYCGGLTRKTGIEDALADLARQRFRVLVIGEVGAHVERRLLQFDNIVFTGRCSYADVPDLLALAAYGLNYTPDVYPLNMQTSTKTLEYCAAGLKIISNRYPWMTQFEEERAGRFAWLGSFGSREELDSIDCVTPDVLDLEWDKVLREARLDDYLEETLRL